MTRDRRLRLVCLLGVFALAGCRQDMHDQPKYEPFEQSDFFADGQASRPQIEGTVARGQLREDTAFYQGLDAEGALLATLPIELDAATLARGRDQYDAFCSPCHDRAGTGNGMVVRRGFKRPESLHVVRLRDSAPGYFFQVMTNGFGEMSSYAGQIDPYDRWAIAAYVRALQLSQALPVKHLDMKDRDYLAFGGYVPPESASDSPAEEGH